MQLDILLFVAIFEDREIVYMCVLCETRVQSLDHLLSFMNVQ